MTNERVGSSAEEPTGPVIRDKRRIDPETGQLRDAETATAKEFGLTDDNKTTDNQETPGSDSAFGGEVGDDLPTTEAVNDDAQQVKTDQKSDGAAAEGTHPDTALAAERLADLQRLQAEYVNYKRRVDRDREQSRDLALTSFVESLLPVLDEVHLAREHGDLEEGTPFAKIADKLDAILSKYGLSSFGEAGDAFDPMHHEALMHVQAELPEGSEGTTVVQVMQPGYKVGDRVVRAARVAVADPQ